LLGGLGGVRGNPKNKKKKKRGAGRTERGEGALVRGQVKGGDKVHIGKS